MSTDWRNFGGVKRYEKNSITNFNSLIVDQFTVKEFYNGIFTVSGELFIIGKTNLQNDVAIRGNTNIDGNVKIKNKLSIDGNTDISGNLDICGNVIIYKDLELKGNTIFSRDVKVGRSFFINDLLYIGGTTDANSNIFFKTNANNLLGLNVLNPTATFDISGGSVNTLKMKTSSTTNVNIISIDVSNDGITVSTDGSKNVIKFWNGQEIPFTDSSLNTNTILEVSQTDPRESSITYYREGNIAITCPSNTFINSNITIGKNTKGKHQLNETAIISDVSYTPYLYNYYDVSFDAYKTSNALTLLSTLDNSSNIGLNLVTSSLNRGITINGGTYIKDTSRSFGAVTIFDVCGASVPVQLTVAGNNKAYLKSTTAFNTLIVPTTEKYSVWINGPLRVTNDEIQVVLDVSFEVNTILNSSSTEDTRCVLAGSSSGKIGRDYEHPILYTTDGGKNWSKTTIVDSANLFFTGGCIYNNYYTFLSSTSGGYYYSSDGNQTWRNIVIQNIGTSISDIFALSHNSDNVLLFTKNTNEIIRVVLDDFSNMGSSTAATKYNIIGEKTETTGISSITCIRGVFVNGDNIIYVAGNGIRKYKINPSLTVSNQSSVTSVFSSETPIGSNQKTTNSYNAMSVTSTLAVFVGNNGIITYDTNVSTMNSTFEDVNASINSFTGVTFQDVKINQSEHVIVVGNNGKIFYSLNRCKDWSSTIPNYYGMEGILKKDTNTLTSIGIAGMDSIIVGSMDISYITDTRTGRSRVFYCHWPDLFNHANNSVADICGNMNIDGFLTVKDDARIRGNLDLSGTATIYGNVTINDASLNINGVTSMNREVFVNANMTVDKSYVFTSTNPVVQGKLDISNNNESDGITSGALVLRGGLGIYRNLNVGGKADISSNLRIGGNMDICGNANIEKDLSTNGIFYANNTTDSTQFNIGSVVVKGGMGVAGNVFMNNRLQVGNPDSMIDSNIINDQTLVVQGGVGIKKNVNIGGSVDVSTNLTITGIEDSTDIESGALVITKGGMGVFGNSYIGGRLVIESSDVNAIEIKNGGGLDVSGIVASGIVQINNTKQAISPDTGALRVDGGVGVNGNIYIGEQIFSSITLTTVDKATAGLQILNSGAWIQGNVFTDSNLDVRGYVRLNKELYFTSSTTNDFIRYTAGGDLSYNATGNHVFNRSVGIGTNAPDFNLDVSGTARVMGDASFNGLVRMTNGLSSDSKTGGALVVSGGVGISENMNVGGYVRLNKELYFTSSTTNDFIRYTTGGDLSYNATGNHVFNNSIGVGVYPSYNLDVSGTTRLVSYEDTQALYLGDNGALPITTNGATLSISRPYGNYTRPHLNFNRPGHNTLQMGYLTDTDVSHSFGIFSNVSYNTGDGTPAICITKDGLVGINRRNPTYNLDVDGSARITGDASLDTFTTVNGTVSNILYFDYTNSVLNTYHSTIQHQTVNAIPVLRILGAGRASDIYANRAVFINDHLIVNQKIGINTGFAIPTYNLDVSGNARISGNSTDNLALTVGGYRTQTDIKFKTSTGHSDCDVTLVTRDGSTSDANKGTFYIYSGSTVISSPLTTGQLTIIDTSRNGLGSLLTSTTASLVLKHTAANGQSSILFPSASHGSDYGYIQYVDTSFGFNSGEKSRLVIGIENDIAGNSDDCIVLLPCAGSGNVGINTYHPAYNLDVSGNARVSSNLLVTGNIGIGKTSPAFNLDISGQVQIYNRNRATALLVGDVSTPNLDTRLGTVTITRPINDFSMAHIAFIGGTSNTSVQMGYLKDTNTFGIFQSINYNNVLGIQPVISISQANFLGVNTGSPAYHLDVSGTTRLMPSGDNTALFVGDNNNIDTTSYGLVTLTRPVLNYSRAHMAFVRSGENVVQMGFLQGNDVSNNFGIFQATGYGYLPEQSANNGVGTPAISLSQYSNFVGINRRNPSYNLDVSGNARISGNSTDNLALTVGGYRTQTDIKFKTSTGHSDCDVTLITGDGSTSDANKGTFYIFSGSTVISSPLTTGQLTIIDTSRNGLGSLLTSTTASLVLKHTAANGQSSILFPSASHSSDYGYIQYVDTSFGFNSGEKSRLVIGIENDIAGDLDDCIVLLPCAGSGNVGINTYHPAYNLDVSGTTRITGTLNAGATTVSSLTIGSDNIANSISALQTTTSGHTSSISALQTTTSGHTSSISALQSTTATQTSNISTLQSTTATQSSNISTLQSTTATQSSNISTLQSTLVNYYGVKTNVTINNNEIITNNLLARDYLEVGNSDGSHLTSLNITRPEDYYSLKSHINFHRDQYNMFSMGYLGGQRDFSNTFGFFNNYTYYSDPIKATNTPVMCFKEQKVGINIKDPTYNLDVGGSANITGQVIANSFNALSDYRIKENVINLKKTDYTVDQLRAVYYYNNQTKKQDIGLIAHELQETYPFLVTGEKDGKVMQSVNYTGLIGVLIKEIQTLKQEIQTLKQETQTLKEEKKNQDTIISALIKRIEKLEHPPIESS